MEYKAVNYMIETIKRIRKVIEASGETQTGFAKRIGLTPAYIWKILNKDNAMPSDRTIADICREFKVSEEWIRTGNGAMFADYKDYADLDLIMTEIQESDDDLIKSIVRAYWKLPDEKKAAIRDLVDGIISNLEKEKPGD